MAATAQHSTFGLFGISSSVHIHVDVIVLAYKMNENENWIDLHITCACQRRRRRRRRKKKNINLCRSCHHCAGWLRRAVRSDVTTNHEWKIREWMNRKLWPDASDDDATAVMRLYWFILVDASDPVLWIRTRANCLANELKIRFWLNKTQT